MSPPDAVAQRLAAILGACEKVLDAAPAARDQWREELGAIERAIENGDRKAAAEAAARGDRLLGMGLPPPWWVYYNATFLASETRDAARGEALIRGLTAVQTAADRGDRATVGAALEQLRRHVEAELAQQDTEDRDRLRRGGLERR